MREKKLARGDNGGRRVQAVERALELIEALAREPAGLALGAVSGKVGLAVQTAQSLLRTLQYHGWVVQQGRGAPYRLGPALGVIQRSRDGQMDRGALAAEIARRLSEQIGEYVVVAEWTGDRLTPLVEVRPDRELVVGGESFTRDRLHVMATGKLLIAYLDTETRQKVVASLPLTKAGPKSVTNAKELLSELETIRKQGYACCVDEGALGVTALAVPVCDEQGCTTNAALGISLPSVRYNRKQHQSLLKQLHATAAEIAAAWRCL